MAGVSQSMRMYSPKAPELFCSMAVDQHEAAGWRRHRLRRRPAPAGAELHFVPWAVATSAAMAQEAALPQAGQFIETGAAQAAARREQRDGFEQIGLARAIGAGQRDEARRYVQPEAGIIAEIGEGQAGESKAG